MIGPLYDFSDLVDVGKYTHNNDSEDTVKASINEYMKCSCKLPTADPSYWDRLDAVLIHVLLVLARMLHTQGVQMMLHTGSLPVSRSRV